MMTGRGAAEPHLFKPGGRPPSMSLGAGEPASEPSPSALGRFVDRRFGAGLFDWFGRSAVSVPGTLDIIGSASELRRFVWSAGLGV